MGKNRIYEECHREINGIIEKQCSICEKWFPDTEDYFYHSFKTDILFPYCKKCSSQKSAKWRKDNVEKVREIDKKIREHPKRKATVREANKQRRDKGLYREWQRNNMDK
jgi:hypothetical protein